MQVTTGMSMEVSNQLVSWFITYLRDLQPTYIGVIIQLLSTHGHPSTIIHRENGCKVLDGTFNNQPHIHLRHLTSWIFYWVYPRLKA